MKLIPAKASSHLRRVGINMERIWSKVMLVLESGAITT
jgi:hypothetical protein